MSLLQRVNKTCAFGVVNNEQKCNIGGELPHIAEADILVRDEEDGSTKVVVARGRKKFTLAATCVAPTHLVNAARRAARTSNATFHHSIMPQHMMDATTVIRHSSVEATTDEIVDMMGITRAPALCVEQYEEMVRAWYWSSMTFNPELLKRCELTTAAYKCFGWELVAKLSGKSKT